MPALDQSWTEVTRELRERWTLCASLGLNFEEKPDGCAALAKIVGEMARIIDNEIDRRNEEKTMTDRPFNAREKPTAKAMFELLARLKDRGFEFEYVSEPPEGDTRPLYNVTVKDQDIADAHDLIQRLVFGGKA